MVGCKNRDKYGVSKSLLFGYIRIEEVKIIVDDNQMLLKLIEYLMRDKAFVN